MGPRAILFIIGGLYIPMMKILLRNVARGVGLEKGLEGWGEPPCQTGP